MDIWEANGKEYAFKAQAEFCILQYNGGCGYIDTSCSALCIEEQFGFSNNCGKCFGFLIDCGFEYSCSACVLDQGASAACVECMATCFDEFILCSGLLKN